MLVDKDALVVSLVGEITWQTAPRLRERLQLLVSQGHRSLILNMDGVDYADSSGLAMIISVSRKIRAVNGHILLINTSDAVMRALHQARLADLIPAVGKNMMRHNRVSLPPADATPLLVRTMGVPRDPGAMADARGAVGAMLASLGLARETTFDLVLALGEALGNAFDHGCDLDDGSASVTVTVSVYGDRVVMEVTDSGCGFEMGEDLPEPTETRGRGIRLMLMLTDSVDIHPRTSGKGTCVRLVKMIDEGDISRAAMRWAASE